jgi:hypothetical protein
LSAVHGEWFSSFFLLNSSLFIVNYLLRSSFFIIHYSLFPIHYLKKAVPLPQKGKAFYLKRQGLLPQKAVPF